MNEEWWTFVDGFNKRFWISTNGRVYNNRTKRFLKGHLDKKGYPHVCLYLDGKSFTKKNYRLVMESFVENTENKPEVNHIDEDKANSFIGNLEWSTRKENIDWSNIVEKLAVINTNGNSSKPVAQYSLDGNLINFFPSCAEAARATKSHPTEIVSCCTGKLPKACGYMWTHFTGDLPPNKISVYKNKVWRTVEQYDIKHNFINKYLSITKAAIAVKGNATQIRAHSKTQKPYREFYWKIQD